MNRIGSLIAPLAKGLGIEGGLKLESMRREWARIFGEPLSLHMHPSTFKNGELLISVDSPIWLQQITFLKTDILARVRSFGVREVRFMLGKVRPPGRVRDAGARPHAGRPLDSDTREYIERTVSGIDDAELRDRIKRAMERALAQKNRRPY